MRMKVCIQGLGFVGAATAVAIGMAEDIEGNPLYDVVGVDLPTKSGMERIDAINHGTFPLRTSDSKLIEALEDLHRQGNLSATSDESIYADADIIVVDIHLDIAYLDDEPQLQFESFKDAIRTIGKYVREGTLIIIETTVPPGTCEKIVVPTLTSELITRNMDKDKVLVAHSYERVMPGEDYLDSIINYWRVFAGHTKEAGDACEKFLSSIININSYPLTRLSSTTASETAKIMENTYRAANIAFIDEWTKYAEAVGIDLFEVIDAIRIRPTHSNIRFPGLGVGGYCLTKDPTFADAATKQLFNIDSLKFPFSRMAVRVNHDMPLHTISRLNELLGDSLKNKRILICGVSYRQNVGDTRYSPTEILIKKLQNLGTEIVAHDPYVTYWEELGWHLHDTLPDPAEFNGIILCVPHKDYKKLDYLSWLNGTNTILLDANNVLSKHQREAIRSMGVCVESIGRGDGL